MIIDILQMKLESAIVKNLQVHIELWSLDWIIIFPFDKQLRTKKINISCFKIEVEMQRLL